MMRHHFLSKKKKAISGAYIGAITGADTGGITGGNTGAITGDAKMDPR